MEIKPPVPQIPIPLWKDVKDLQEWETHHQRRPETGDQHSSALRAGDRGHPPFPGRVRVTTVADGFFNWARKSSVWPVSFGLACCAIEMMATFASRFDVERLGMVPWASPRHSDLMIVSGTVTIKMAPMLERIYNQMPDPKWAVSMGSCANSGGPFRHGYHVVKGVDRIIPVDVYVPGCPPPPESLLNGLLLLQDQIAHFRRTGHARRARARRWIEVTGERARARCRRRADFGGAEAAGAAAARSSWPRAGRPLARRRAVREGVARLHASSRSSTAVDWKAEGLEVVAWRREPRRATLGAAADEARRGRDDVSVDRGGLPRRRLDGARGVRHVRRAVCRAIRICAASCWPTTGRATPCSSPTRSTRRILRTGRRRCSPDPIA